MVVSFTFIINLYIKKEKITFHFFYIFKSCHLFCVKYNNVWNKKFNQTMQIGLREEYVSCLSFPVMYFLFAVLIRCWLLVHPVNRCYI